MQRHGRPREQQTVNTLNHKLLDTAHPHPWSRWEISVFVNLSIFPVEWNGWKSGIHWANVYFDWKPCHFVYLREIERCMLSLRRYLHSSKKGHWWMAVKAILLSVLCSSNAAKLLYIRLKNSSFWCYIMSTSRNGMCNISLFHLTIYCCKKEIKILITYERTM